MSTEQTDAGGPTNSATVKQTIVETIEAPRLTDINVSDFVAFQEKRAVYEIRVQEKNQDSKVEIPLTTYRSSIDESVIELFIIAKWIDATSINEITEDQLKRCIATRARVDERDYDLGIIERDISAVKMEKACREANLEKQVWRLCLKYKTTLKNYGYDKFIQNKPTIAIKHIFRRITDRQLKLRMQMILQLHKEEYKEDFYKFIRKAAEEARAIDLQHSARRYLAIIEAENSDAEFTGEQTKENNPPQRKENSNCSNGNNQTHKPQKDVSSKSKWQNEKRKSKRKFSSCLNPDCNESHALRDCKNTSPELKAKLREKYYADRRKKRHRVDQSGSIGGIQSSNVGNHTSLFSASFCEGAVETMVMADQGSDGNILPPSILKAIMKADPTVQVTNLTHPVSFSNPLLSADRIKCMSTVKSSVRLRVKHGSALALSNIVWYVAEQKVGCVYVGRHVLAAIGLDNRKLLQIACDEHSGFIDVEELMSAKGQRNSPGAGAVEGSICGIQSVPAPLGSSFHSRGESSGDRLESTAIYIDLGEDTEEELQAALNTLVQKAKENGMGDPGITQLTDLLHRYKSSFRVRLGKTPPASVRPMKIRLQKNKSSVRVKARRYPPFQRQFLEKYTKALIDMGFFVDMPTAEWQAAPLLVPKPGSKAHLRMAVDLRPVNATTLKESWPMPNLDSEIFDFADSTVFASLDFVSAYWQLPLHEDSVTSCGVVTPKGTMASKRVLPGLANATSYFQSTVEPLFADLRDNMKAWLDDFNLHAKDEASLLSLLERFFQTCKQKQLYLSARKSVLFAKELRWCGRIIDGKGYTMDPASLESLRNMEVPRTAGELAQFVYCCRWMAISIPDFTALVAPLTAVFEKAYTRSGKRTTKSIKKILLSSLSWGPEHERVYREIRDSLEQAVKLAYPDPAKVTCVFTDASDYYWSAVVTQTTKDQLTIPVANQRHESLAFLGSAFKKAELNWTTFEKEAFAIFQTFEKLDYMLSGRPDTGIFTDHRNLLFVFAPLILSPTLGKHVVAKVQRWAFYLSQFDYVIEHIKGDDNVFADILTRWTRGYRDPEPRLALCSIVHCSDSEIVPAADHIKWPGVEDIRKSQETHADRREKLKLNLDSGDNLWKTGSQIWVPEEDKDLQLKLLVLSHCGTLGHR